MVRAACDAVCGWSQAPLDGRLPAIAAAPLALSTLMALILLGGFALVGTGLTRAKNAVHTTAMNLMVFPLSVLGYFVCGFAFMGAGNPELLAGEGAGGSWGHGLALGGLGFLGTRGFFLSNLSAGPEMLGMFLLQIAPLGAAAAIPIGAMAERWKFSSFMIYGFVSGILLFPIAGHWIWGGGWLSQLGSRFHWGHGFVDATGSAVVHLTGGVIALVGTWFLGPRLGKFNRDGTPNPIPPHNVPMSSAGALVLTLGWLGFSAARFWQVPGTRIEVMLVNTLLSASLGAVGATLWMWRFRSTKPDPTISANGLLAGLVAISASAPTVTPTASCLIGALAGILAVEAVFFMERRLLLDDPVGAISVHGVCGAWGTVAAGLFPNGSGGMGWNGVPGPVVGIFHGDAGQLLAQLVGLVAHVLLVGLLSAGLFKASEVLTGNRVRPEAEFEGLDVPEMGLPGYGGIVLDKASETPSSR
jgi:Amt family ammonium transporter